MFFNNLNWCKSWTRCEKRCCSNHCHKKDDDHNQQDIKCCHTDQSHNHNNNCYQSNHKCDRFDDHGFDRDTYGYSNFRYYDQYGNFNNFDNNCRDDIEDKFEHDKPCKPSYNKCQPTKFICFQADKC